MNPDQRRNPSPGRRRRLSQQRGRAALILLVFLCFGDIFFLKAHAAPQPAPLSLSSNRFLFVVETSAAMQSRAPGVLQMAVKLLMSDLNGNLRRGDTLGLWTFNQELYAGRFPLQVWSADRRQTITQRVVEFLRQQPLEKKADLGPTLAQVLQVVKNSDNITVILFTDGAEQIRGTPFDNEINSVFKDQQRNMQKAAMPFITVLRAQGGTLVNHSVNFAPWPVDIPIVPTPYEAAQIAAAQSPPTNPPPAVSTATNPIVLTVKEKKIASAAETKDEKPPTPAPVAPAKAIEPATAKTEPPVELPPAKPETPLVAAIPKPVATPANEPPKKESSEPQPAPKPAAAEVAPTVAKSETPVSPNPQAETKPAPSPATSSSVQAAATQSTNVSASGSPPVQTAVAVPPQSFFSGKKLLFAAIALFMAAVFLVILLVRRARPQEKISLITRSMDRDQW